MDEVKKSIDIFGKQLELFGKSCTHDDIYFKPFSILKICYSNGTEIIPAIDITKIDHSQFDISTNDIGNVQLYNILSNNPTLTLDLNMDLTSNITLVKEFWQNHVASNNYEGIVIKPDFVNIKYAPAVKVRNNDYLHIIYGYDYLTEHKYDKLIKKKHIRDKLNASIREYQIGLHMLQVRYDEIVDSNIIKDIYYTFICEEEMGKKYDSAL